MIRIYYADGRIEKLAKNELTLEDAQRIVEGYVEIFTTKIGQVIVNEEGLLINLPHNKNASVEFGRHLVGNAIFLSGDHMWD